MTTLYDLALLIGTRSFFEVMQAGFSVLLRLRKSSCEIKFLYEFQELIPEANENCDFKKLTNL